jgi:hypothetical protein
VNSKDEADERDEGGSDVVTVDDTPGPGQREARELAPFNAGGGLNAMVPQTPEEYARMGKLLIEAGCVPASYEGRDPHETRAKLIIGLMKSVEIGIPPITGLNGIMIVNNRPSVWGDLAVSLIQKSGLLQQMQVRQIGGSFDKSADVSKWPDDFGFRVMMWREGQESPYVGEFTVRDAKRAGLWMNHKKQPWIKYPLDMLFARARAKTMRMGFADALHGMAIVEEARDVAPEEPKRIDTSALFCDEPQSEDASDLLTEPDEEGPR